MDITRILQANTPAKMIGNIIFLSASAVLSLYVLVMIPEDPPLKAIFALLAIGLEIIGAYNLALAIKRKSVALFVAYGAQVLFILSLHLIAGLAMITANERETVRNDTRETTTAQQIAQNLRIIDSLNATIQTESKTGMGWRITESLKRIDQLKRENERLTVQPVHTNAPRVADAFGRLERYTGIPAGVPKVVIFCLLSLLIQYALFLTAWKIPEDDVKDEEKQPSSLSAWVKDNRALLIRYIDGAFPDGIQRLNSDARMVKAGMTTKQVQECKRALQQIRLAGGPPMIETRQGTTVRNYQKEKVIETIKRIG